jgi:hypothetical protein
LGLFGPRLMESVDRVLLFTGTSLDENKLTGRIWLKYNLYS